MGAWEKEDEIPKSRMLKTPLAALLLLRVLAGLTSLGEAGSSETAESTFARWFSATSAAIVVGEGQESSENVVVRLWKETECQEQEEEGKRNGSSGMGRKGELVYKYPWRRGSWWKRGA